MAPKDKDKDRGKDREKEKKAKKNKAEKLVLQELKKQGFEVLSQESDGDTIKFRLGIKLSNGHPTGLSVHPVGRAIISRHLFEQTADELDLIIPKIVAQACGAAAREPIMKDLHGKR